MEFKQLEYFVRVAEAGSFTKAAALLHVAQPALSRQIRQLEETLQTRLLVRNGRGALATEEGERLLVQSRGILRQVARVKEEIEGMRGTMAGRVAIGMPVSIASYLSLSLVKKLREIMPNAELAILQGRSALLQEWLSSGRIDFAVLFDVPFSPLIEKIHLVTTKLLLIQSADRAVTSPVRLNEITVPLIIQCQPNSVRMMVEMEMSRIGHEPRIAMEIDNLKIIVELVRDNFGAAIVSQRAFRNLPHPSALSARPIMEPELKLNLSLAIPVRPLPRIHKAIIGAIKEVTLSVFAPPPALAHAAAA